MSSTSRGRIGWWSCGCGGLCRDGHRGLRARPEAGGSFGSGCRSPIAAGTRSSSPIPLDQVQEDRLAWYSRSICGYPFLDQEVAGQAVEDLRPADSGCSRRCSAAPPPTTAALADGGSTAAGCRCRVGGVPPAALGGAARPGLRRAAGGADAGDPPGGAAGVAVRASPPGRTLNILVVTARPDGPRDVGYRTISRPLLDGLRQADRPVLVDLVRPGTWSAVRERLRRDVTERTAGLLPGGALRPARRGRRARGAGGGRAAQRYLFGAGRRRGVRGRARRSCSSRPRRRARRSRCRPAGRGAAGGAPGAGGGVQRLPVGEGTGQRGEPGAAAGRGRRAGGGRDGVLGDGVRGGRRRCRCCTRGWPAAAIRSRRCWPPGGPCSRKARRGVLRPAAGPGGLGAAGGVRQQRSRCRSTWRR